MESTFIAAICNGDLENVNTTRRLWSVQEVIVHDFTMQLVYEGLEFNEALKLAIQAEREGML